MHFEVLVEDQSGKKLLDVVISKILGEDTEHSFRVISYKGVGRLPRGLKPKTDADKRILLDQLPRLIRGYGKSLLPRDQNAVIVVVDNDDKDCVAFKSELLAIQGKINPSPRMLFRIAIEEMEAWILGDREAILEEFPKAKTQPLDNYTQDSVCGTWEVLADALYPGGSTKLKDRGFPHTGIAKCGWAETIARSMDPSRNRSRSFHAFRDAFSKLIGGAGDAET